MIAALKESTLSSPLGTACCFLSTAPARTLRPGPSKALLFPSVGSDLWNIFAERKVTGKQDRTRKVVSHLVVKKILKFLISENRGKKDKQMAWKWDSAYQWIYFGSCNNSFSCLSLLTP